MSTVIDVLTTPDVLQGTILCVEIVGQGPAGGSTMTGTFMDMAGTTACAFADMSGDATGIINLMISGGAMSLEQISLQGCIDISGFTIACDSIDPLSPVVVVTVP